MTLRQTTALCNVCATSHPASVVREENQIFGLIHCPRGERRYPISSDSDLYLRFTRAAGVNPDEPPPDDLRFALNYLSITNACNFHCKVCAAEAGGPGIKNVFLGRSEILHRAQQMKKYGSRFVQLFGGEPTVHPDLQGIIKQLVALGFKVGISTNGYDLGVKPELARTLKHSGLDRVCLQFDSLNEKTLCKFDRSYLKEKIAALQNALQAGLRVGLNCTVTADNLAESAELMSFGLDQGAGMWNITFASAAPMGRYLINVDDDVPDREMIVKQLLQIGKRYHFSLDDFTPLPCFRPWGMEVHPDCGIHLVFIRTPHGIRPLNYYLDMHRLHREMLLTKRGRGVWSGRVLPLLLVYRSIRPGRRCACIGLGVGLLFNAKRYAVMNVAVTDYRAAMFLDEQRLRRCSGAVYTSVGPVRGCVHFFMGADFPGSHRYELHNGGC